MRKFSGVLCTLLALAWVGCDRVDKSLQAEDETNPHIRQALAAQREFNYAEAAKDYEDALRACPDVATAHFDLGLLYADRLNDPIRAMYHFQCYIDQRPHADNREGTEKRLESLKIQFASTVPNSPIQNAEAFAKLQSDNQNLVKELDDSRVKISGLEEKIKSQVSNAGSESSVPINAVKDAPDAKGETPTPAPLASDVPPTPAPAGSPAPMTPETPAGGTPAIQSNAEAEPAPAVTAATPPVAPALPPATPAASPGVPPSAANPAPVAPAVPVATAAERTHIIAKGDTLWSIAKKYYPGQITSGIEKIKAANPEKLGEGKPLKIGVTLTIP